MIRKNRMIKIFVSLLVLLQLLAFQTSESPEKWLKFPDNEKFKSEWRKVEALEKKGLPKSAIKIVEQIYEAAKKTNNHAQIAKALVYRSKFISQTEEEAFPKIIGQIEDEIDESKFPLKQILHSYAASYYWAYFSNNQWRINQRRVIPGFQSDDISDWDKMDFRNKMLEQMYLSLENADSLKMVRVSDFEDIVSKGTQPKNLRPGLYDFLAHRAIQYFGISKNISPVLSDDQFLADKKFFAPAKKFAKLEFLVYDSASHHFKTLKLYQQILSFRLKQENIPALIDVDLARLDYVFINSTFDKKDSLYLDALKIIQEKYSGNNYVAEVIFREAEYYSDKTKYYNALDSTTFIFKEYAKTAEGLFADIIENFSESHTAEKSLYKLENLRKKELKMNLEKGVIPGQSFPCRIEYKNIDELFYRILKIDTTDYFNLIVENRGRNLIEKLINKSELAREKEMGFDFNKDLNKHSIEFLLKGLPVGKYVFIISNNKKFNLHNGLFAWNFIDVSNIAYINRANRYLGQNEIVVVNRDNGKALSGINIDKLNISYSRETRSNEIIKTATLKTNKQGFVKLLPEEGRYRSNFILIFKNGKDFLIADDNFYNPGKRNKSKQKICNFFLDRKIYRPGQVVYFKGIINTGKGAKSEVVPEQKVNVQLFDANWQSLKEHEFVSNKFGSFSGSFTLPKSALTGNFTIKNEFGSINFRVEEYKRPKILVEFLPVEGQYRFNDIVQVKGTVKSYTGHPVGFAEIKYTIKRSSFGGYKSLYMPWASERQIAYDEIHANEKGEFEINFKALCPSTKDKNSKFHFTVSVDATDQNGETQSSSKRISINKNAIYIESDFPNKIDLSEIPENEFKLLVKTANGQEIDNVINVEVFQLEAPALLYPKKMQESEVYLLSRKQWHDQYSNHEYRNELDIKNYRVKKQLAKFSIDTKEKKNIVLDQLGKRLPGVYKIKFSTKDKFGREVENIVYPEFFDSQSKKLHIPKTDWFVALNKKVEPGETAKFLIGTGIAKVHILYEIFHQDKFVKQEWISLKKGQTLIEIPVEEKYRGGFNVAFTFISNNHVFSFSERVDVPFSNKDLDISFGTFREELYPGEDEQWRVTIRGHKGEKIAAEMLCGMYDASLDRFAPNRWNSFFRAPHFYLNSYSASTFNQVHAKSFYRNYKHPEWPGELYYKQLLWFGYGGYALNAGGMRGSRQSFGFMLNSRGEKGITSDAEMPMAVENSIAPVPESPMEQMEIVSQDKNKETFDEASDELKIDNVYTRSNFNETAFFYPHLQTNKDGDVVISFIMPESLTRWNINGIAHTKELDIGTFHKELISKKELMAEANPPRFFREGDRIVFPVKISNMSDKALNCLVRLEFVNALNNEKIKISVEDEQQLFSVPENGNQTLTWELNIPENVHAITYTVKALTRTFSDGEEKTIPVLTNRILVTESLPMSIRKSGKTSFGFKKLKENKSTTLKHHKLTLEFTQNPAWYAVQALPYLMKFPHECAEQIFSRYYANSLAGHIVNSMPEIKRVFEQWKISDNKETFLSNLEKNQDLKNIILNETPWVRDALNENQQKENIALLFDLNKMKDELKLAWQQLEKMQNPNGSWPWFPGLRENRYITQHIVAGMGHLKHLGVIDLNSKHSQFNAIRQAILYLDKEMYRDYIRIKSSKEIHSFLIHYLYMRSYFPDIRLSQLHETAFDHYIAEAKKDWLKFNKYEQSMIALALHRQGDTETPMDIIKSLKEFSISSDEFGMYWKSGNAYYWNEAPIEQQAMMIELFKEVAKDPQAVNELKIWLLKQKQTQAWKTTKATANAVYALLLSGDNWLDSKEELSIKIGEQTIQPAKDEDLALEAGTGYFKKSWDAGEITPTMSEITVTKSTDRLSWGAVYWQYFEDLDKITEHSAGLSMIKKLYIERKEKDKTELVLISDENMPQIGDKLIVRIHLKSDRNLEFVHMKDMRASGLEPINFLSGHRYQGGMYYYESIRDASVNFFFDGLRKGDYVFEYPLRVIHNGDFSNGITTIQCMYAPEFSAHSEGVELRIE